MDFYLFIYGRGFWDGWAGACGGRGRGIPSIRPRSPRLGVPSAFLSGGSRLVSSFLRPLRTSDVLPPRSSGVFSARLRPLVVAASPRPASRVPLSVFLPPPQSGLLTGGRYPLPGGRPFVRRWVGGRYEYFTLSVCLRHPAPER